MTAFTWYAMGPDLKTQEQGSIELAAALAVIDAYFARQKPSYESGEDALSETMFGFARAPDDFIEICLHTASEISFTSQLPPSPAGGFFAKLKGGFRRERTLDSRDALRRQVTAYFTMTPEAFKAEVD